MHTGRININMYLDFDPKSLKVAQLRGILNEYDISFPSNAKKTDLIKLFNDEIKPNASKYLKEYEKSIKNLNDVGFINATTGKTVRRSKRSTSADVELSDSEKEKKSKGAKISEQASDISGLESDTEATNEAKKTRKKTKDSKKTKKSSKEEITEKVGASSDASEIESGAKQTSRIKDDEKSDVKGTINSAIKSESSFTNENVFQSPPSSAGIKKTRSPSNYKSPSTSKKRHRENDENQEGSPDTTKKAKVPSSKSPKPSSDTRLKSTPHKTGHLFDDNESSDSDTDIFSKSIINQVKSPKLSKIKKPSSKKSTPVKVEKQTPVKKSTPGDINALYQNITPSLRTRESQHLLSAKSSSKKTNSIKNSAKKNNSAISDSTFLSLSDEQDDFDKEQSKIKSRGKSSTHETPSGVDILASTDLASQLGITIQGLPPKDFQLSDNSFASIKSHTPTKKLSPRPRKHKSQKISQTDLDKLSDDDDEDEDDYEEEEKSGKKFDKIQKGIEEEIEKLNDVVEKENSVSIRKPSALNIFSFISLWLIILSVGLSGYWYREQTYLIGYCGQEINQSTIPQSSDLPNWLVQFGTYLDNNFKPNCVKCPAHARCYPYLEIGCYEDFVEYKPWYFDFIPIINPSLKKCVPDTKKAEKLEIMIDVALDLLRSKNANKNCGKTAVDNFESGLSVDELHDLLLLMKAPYITKEEFEELWQRSVIELEKEPEIIVRQVFFFKRYYFKHGITNI
ncbi:unnamed protein product [Debaryomyces fabryi]|nr:unnamed protein product [Debaryomyces fabryi]